MTLEQEQALALAAAAQRRAATPDYAAQSSGMDPVDMSIARAKNDGLGSYLREQAKIPRKGESETDRGLRLYGSIGRPGTASGMMRAYLQGGTFGAGDEIVAAGAAGLDTALRGKDFGKAYDYRVGNERRKIDQFRNDSPVLAYGTEIAGAIPTAVLPIMNLPLAATTRGRVLTSGLTGAGQGALYGANTGEGMGRVENAGIGGGLGMAFGAAGVPLASGVGKLRSLYLTNKAAKAVGTSGPAYKRLSRALQADDSLTGAGARRIDAAGPDAMLADAGTNAQQLLDTAIQRSGPASRVALEAVHGRVGRASANMTNTLDKVMGKPGESSSRALVVYGDKTNPLSLIYKRAYSKAIDYSGKTGMYLEDLVKNRVPAEAIQAANKLMMVEGNSSRQILASIADDGSVVFQTMPDVRQLDYITRGLNQVAFGAEGRGALGGKPPLEAAYGSLSREIRTALKSLVPEYKAATNAASDAIRAKTAREFGQTVLSARVSRGDVFEMLSDMGESEVRKVTEGLRMNIDDALANVKRAMTDNDMTAREGFKLIKDMSSRANHEKVAMILGDDAANVLFRDIDRAAKAFELRAGVARNSQTFAREVTEEGTKAQVDAGVVNALRNMQPVDAARRLGASMMGRSAADKERIMDETYSSIVDTLTGPRGKQAAETLQKLETVVPTVDAGRLRSRNLVEKLMRRNTAVAAPYRNYLAR